MSTIGPSFELSNIIRIPLKSKIFPKNTSRGNLMISIVGIYNNQDLLNDYLLKSLKNQSVEYELILIDNRPQKLNSAAEALNNAAKNAKGEYIMFTHYDISFSDTWLEEIENMLEKIDNLGIAGVAGKPDKGKLKGDVVSNIKDGIPPIYTGIQTKSLKEVQTLDEVAVIVPRHIFNKFKFDEKLGGWHLYVVDYCLNLKKQGLGVFVLPVSLYHRSRPSLKYDYFTILKKLLEKHKDDYNKIYTTCGTWDASIPLKLRLSMTICYFKQFTPFDRIFPEILKFGI